MANKTERFVLEAVVYLEMFADTAVKFDICKHLNVISKCVVCNEQPCHSG